MAHKVICPNAQCRANLKLGREPAPGAKITCPKCGKAFAVGTAPAASPAADGFVLAADSDRSCPDCKTVLSKDATRCNACG